MRVKPDPKKGFMWTSPTLEVKLGVSWSAWQLAEGSFRPGLWNTGNASKMGVVYGADGFEPT